MVVSDTYTQFLGTPFGLALTVALYSIFIFMMHFNVIYGLALLIQKYVQRKPIDPYQKWSDMHSRYLLSVSAVAFFFLLPIFLVYYNS